MIEDPINDTDCLGQLTTFARELSPSTLVRIVAARLGSRDAVIKWFQSLPQANDYGDEPVRVIQCDVPQRVRLFPDDPNCVERSLGALMLLEAIDPKTPRALATVDRPLRHTGLVERYDGHWHAVDLFPRRNANRNFEWGDLLRGTHEYVGKPILKFYLGDSGGKIADQLGEQEDKLVGSDKKKQQPQKKGAPPPAPSGAQRPVSEPKPKPKPQPAQPGAKPTRFDFASLVGAGANAVKGGNYAQKEKAARGARADGIDDAIGGGAGSSQASGGDRGRAHDARAEAQRFWRGLGW